MKRIMLHVYCAMLYTISTTMLASNGQKTFNDFVSHVQRAVVYFIENNNDYDKKTDKYLQFMSRQPEYVKRGIVVLKADLSHQEVASFAREHDISSNAIGFIKDGQLLSDDNKPLVVTDRKQVDAIIKEHFDKKQHAQPAVQQYNDDENNNQPQEDTMPQDSSGVQQIQQENPGIVIYNQSPEIWSWWPLLGGVGLGAYWGSGWGGYWGYGGGWGYGGYGYGYGRGGYGRHGGYAHGGRGGYHNGQRNNAARGANRAASRSTANRTANRATTRSSGVRSNAVRSNAVRSGGMRSGGGFHGGGHGDGGHGGGHR